MIALWCPDCKAERDMDRNGNCSTCGSPQLGVVERPLPSVRLENPGVARTRQAELEMEIERRENREMWIWTACVGLFLTTAGLLLWFLTR